MVHNHMPISAYMAISMSLEPHQLASCLSDVTRLRILTLLHLKGELCVCDIVACLQISQPKVSKHLAILRSHGIILPRREGQWIHYKIDPEIAAWGKLTIEQLVAGCATRSPYREDIDRFDQAALAQTCA